MKKILVIGSLNIDFVVNVHHMPALGETLLSDALEMIPGGKGANQACALGKLGADVTLLGAVGNDLYSETVLESLKKANVDVNHILKINQVSTGIALITVNYEGDNSIIVVQGANKLVSREYIDSKVELIKQSDVVIFQLEIPLDTVIYAADIAKQYGKTVILDPAPAQKSLPKELLRNVDIIKPNETELSILTGISNATQNLHQATDLLRKSGVKNIIVTLGGDGAFANMSDGTVKHFASNKVDVVDTTAAGDSFTAALAFSMIRDKNITDAIEFASKVASIVVTKKGAQSSIPSFEEISKYKFF